MNNKWNERYSSEEYVYGKEPNRFFKEFIDTHEPEKILLPAEGEGRNAVYAAGKGWDVTAFDFSEEGRKKAMRLAREMDVEFRYEIFDLTHFLCGNNMYDSVGLFFVHMSPELRRKFHKALTNCLKPGGYLVLEAFNKRQIRNSSGGPNDVNMLFSMDELRGDFGELNIQILEELVQHFETGVLHRGEAETIRLLAQKNVRRKRGDVRREN
ncbi:MAG: methyltransferase domain-containing protein [bacterium]